MSSSASFGAKGIGSFEKGVKYGYLPSESSIQHEGLIYDYYWETADEKEKLFKASYGAAVSRDPFSNALEYYIGVGLASSLDGDGLYKHGGRPPLNIVIVLDISGSMGARFSGAEETLDKLTVAKNSILALMTHLNEKDRFGFITFDDKADVIHKLDNFSSIDQASFKEKLMKIETRGGTDVGKGLECAFSLYKDVPVDDKNKNRIIFLTDATPTTGDHDGTSMLKLCKKESERGIFTTFIGVGVDFNTNLVSMLSNIRGTNYFSVNSSKEFKKQMDLEFDYMVTVAIFNIAIDYESPHWVAERVYGSPGYEIPTQGRLLYIDSSFPTPKEGSNMTKGGIVIVKLKKTDNDKNGPLHFKVSYEDASGNKFNDKDEFVFPVKEGEEFYSNPSMRKAVLLMRYVNFMKYFLSDYRRKESLPANTSFTPSISFETGIKVYPVAENKEAHGSISMKEMDPDYKKMFEKFVSYFETEMEKIGDSTLDKELKNLNNIRSKGEKN